MITRSPPPTLLPIVMDNEGGGAAVLLQSYKKFLSLGSAQYAHSFSPIFQAARCSIPHPTGDQFHLPKVIHPSLTSY